MDSKMTPISPLPLKPIGYQAVAACMDSDRDLSIYRRFGALNSLNLLYLQSELQELETQLLELDDLCNDPSKGNETWTTPRSFATMMKSGDEHRKVVMDIRRVLEEYNRALKAQKMLLSLEEPEAMSRNSFMQYMRAHPNDMMTADAAFIENEANKADLVALSAHEREPMSVFLGKHFSKLFETKDTQSCCPDDRLVLFSETRIRATVRVLAVAFSSVLPVTGIIALYYIQSPQARLGTIVAFSVLCSLVLTVLSDARNAEIVAATSAFAAVQVVFVSGNVTTAGH